MVIPRDVSQEPDKTPEREGGGEKVARREKKKEKAD